MATETGNRRPYANPPETGADGRRFGRRHFLLLGAGLGAAGTIGVGLLARNSEQLTPRRGLEEALSEDEEIRNLVKQLMGVDSLPEMATDYNEFQAEDGELTTNHIYRWGNIEDALLHGDPMLEVVVSRNDFFSEKTFLDFLNNNQHLISDDDKWYGPQKIESANATAYYGVGEGSPSAGIRIYTNHATDEEVAHLINVEGSHLATTPPDVTRVRLEDLTTALIERTTIGLGSPLGNPTQDLTPSPRPTN